MPMIPSAMPSPGRLFRQPRPVAGRRAQIRVPAVLLGGSPAVAIAVALAAAEAAAQPAADLAAHRAVYEIALSPQSSGSDIQRAEGRIVYELAGSSCRGFETRVRQVTVLATGEGDTRLLDSRTESFEAGDGSLLRFSSSFSADGGANEEVAGEATRDASRNLTVTLTKPEADTVALGEAPLFPNQHLLQVIAAAREGRRTLEAAVFDGSEDGRSIDDTLAIIAARSPETGKEGFPALDGVARWPVTLSFFSRGPGERTPTYKLQFTLYDNGVSGDLRLDFGEFILDATLTSLEILPAEPC